MTDPQRKALVEALLRHQQADKLEANGKLYDAVRHCAVAEIAALEPIIDLIVRESCNTKASAPPSSQS